MYEITATTHSGMEKNYKVIDKKLMEHFFAQFIECFDAHEVVVIDGLTGEVIWEWCDGHFSVINGTLI